ncbi:MAG: hypothetical protein JXB26_04115 [Candidatus Aminicenantes bacterium]|nr:hypothetical protein [Candidatus Aminicenantes bacterium]
MSLFIEPKFKTSLFFCIICLITFPAAAAQEYDSPNGFYIGVTAGYGLIIGGDFDGDTVLTGNGQMFVVPGLSGSPGFGIVLGNKKGKTGYEISYFYNPHKADVLGVKKNGVQHIININYVRHFSMKGKFQPFIAGGMNLAWLPVKDAFYKEDWYLAPGDSYLSSRLVLEGNALYYSIGLNGEAGISYAFNPKFSLNACIFLRLMMIHSARAKDSEGTKWSYSLEDKLFMINPGLNVGLRYYF